MSSTIANAVKNTFAPIGARGAISVSAPRAKAISVAIGMPQPRAPIPVVLNIQ